MTNRGTHRQKALTAGIIRRARRVAGESQAEFGKRFAVDQSTVSRLERSGPPEDGPLRRLLDLMIPQILQSGGAKELTR